MHSFSSIWVIFCATLRKPLFQHLLSSRNAFKSHFGDNSVPGVSGVSSRKSADLFSVLWQNAKTIFSGLASYHRHIISQLTSAQERKKERELEKVKERERERDKERERNFWSSENRQKREPSPSSPFNISPFLNPLASLFTAFSLSFTLH